MYTWIKFSNYHIYSYFKVKSIKWKTGLNLHARVRENFKILNWLNWSHKKKLAKLDFVNFIETELQCSKQITTTIFIKHKYRLNFGDSWRNWMKYFQLPVLTHFNIPQLPICSFYTQNYHPIPTLYHNWGITTDTHKTELKSLTCWCCRKEALFSHAITTIWHKIISKL